MSKDVKHLIVLLFVSLFFFLFPFFIFFVHLSIY